MVTSLKSIGRYAGAAASFTGLFLAPIAGHAADTPVVVNNTTANPVPTKLVIDPAASLPTVVTNTVASPVNANITNNTRNPIGVAVANSVRNPVVSSDVNKPIHTPWSTRFDITVTHGAGNKTFVVPAGKKLVLTYTSADAGVAPGAKILFDLATINNGSQVEAHIPMVDQGQLLGQQVYCMSSPMTVFADPGSTLTVAVLTTDNVGSGGLIVGLYGYLVDATAASFE